MDENEKKAKEDRRKKRKEYVEKIKARPQLLFFFLLRLLIWLSDPACYTVTHVRRSIRRKRRSPC